MRHSSLPEESDHAVILGLVQSDAKALTGTDFLTRSKLDAKVDPACKLKADGDMDEN